MRFAQHGRSLGLTHAARRPAWAGAGFFPRLRSNVQVLRAAYAALAAQTAAGDDLGPAGLWLLDNFHLVEAQLPAIHEGLPPRYFASLPVLVAPPLAGLPRVYGVAWAFVAHTDSGFDAELLVHFLDAYQETCDLGLAELWALPTTLRVVLVENLRRLAERLATDRAARDLANRCCDHIERCSLAHLQRLAEDMAARGMRPVFMAQLGQRLQDGNSGSAARAAADIREWLQQGLPERAQAQAGLAADQAADNLSVSNAVNALRALNDADWPDIVARTSPVMAQMLAQPLFAAEHQNTRDDTLHAIEALARRSRRTELQVAQTLLALMSAPALPGMPPKAAGHWLQGPGRPGLMQALGVHEPWARRWRALRRQGALPAYLGTVGLGSLGLVWVCLPAGVLAPGTGPSGWLLALLMLAPASEVAVALLHRLVSESTRPQPLPRLALASGVPAAHRVLVVVPAMLGDVRGIDGLVHRLRLHQLANPETQAQFALLTDWNDADTALAGPDEALLEHARAAMAALNAPGQSQPLPDGSPRFVLLHRPRQYSASERRWIGWERKRGKLEQLVAELATPGLAGQGAASAFIDLGPLSRPAADVRYLVTLDSDTQLPPGRLRDLVGVAAHPANRPVLAPGGARVVAGYGILQPRLVTPLPQPLEDTVYHRLFAGQSGIDPYSAASSEIYQDLFGEGSFSGKGLLDVQALHAVLAGRLPEGQVLSHDLLEGSLARCAVVTDVTLIEDAPFLADVAAARVHRWTRGDWQLLPLLLASLLPRWLHPAALPLGALNRWKLLDNLRRSLVAPGSLLLLLAAVAGLGPSPLVALLLVLGAFSAGPWLGALAGAVPSRAGVAWRHFLHGALLDLARAAGIGAWHLAMLLQHSLLAVDAIARALWRVCFSQRWLLQWTTAAAVQAAVQSGWRASWRRNASVPLVAVLLATGLVFWPAEDLAGGLLLCGLWGLAPLWTWLVSRSTAQARAAACPAADQALLQAVARDTWRYFERTVTAADHHLPPDNLQTSPREMLARRTSPTNIGLYLLATACAREFGWINTSAMLQRLEDTLATLERMPRHRGHFYNWYDTATAQPLLPLYVSTVDSGNCSGHLLAVAQACLALARAPVPPAQALGQRLRHMAARCQRLAWAPEFGFLYHPRRHLLHIGWRAAEDQLDDSFYDLLASEARLTSLLAIAKGDVPVRHWAALGRPFQAVGVTAGLWSWSGSMFEYLMPGLVLAEPHGSVLRQASCAAVLEQQAFANAQGVPWGISESAYAGSDYTLAYQYAPQGVPRLALRRTPAEELVVAPYATALAAMLAPQAAAQNFARLQALGARGDYGFIEALDFSPARQTAGGNVTPVHTYMAHHQAMSVVALAQLLLAGAPQRWAAADPHIEAMASLLHERAPREISALRAPLPGPLAQAQRARPPSLLRTVLPGMNRVEPTQLLSNGRYSVALRANGAGHSRWGDIEVGRTRDDALRDACGHFFFVRTDAADPVVPLSAHPAPATQAHDGPAYHAVFHTDRVVLEARWPADTAPEGAPAHPLAGLNARVTVWVSPEDDIEFRRVELQHDGPQPLALELLSVFEPTLAPARADEAHPAFSQMFLSLHTQAAQRALLFERRPRLAGEAGAFGAHFLAQTAAEVQGLMLQADRAAWAGRNRAPGQPRAALQPWPPGQPDGPLDTALDPVCALGLQLQLLPGRPVCLTFATAVAADAATLQAVIDKYLQPSHIERAALMSATLAGVRLRDLRLSTENASALQALSTALLLTLARPQALADAPLACNRRLLWRFGISGDRPIVFVTVAALPGLGLVRALSNALRLWSWGGVACDLVVLNTEASSYLMPLQHELLALCEQHEAGAAARSRQAACGWHLLRAEDVSAEERATLQTLARVRLLADGRSLAHHLQEWATGPAGGQPALAWGGSPVQALPTAPHRADEPALPAGQFTPDSRAAFQFSVGAGQRPARPWANVLANEGFGSIVTEAGGGNSWAVNSRMNQITPWTNDAVGDPPGEWLLLQDLATRAVWSATPSAWAEPGVAHSVEHAQGTTRMQHRRGDLTVTLCWCVDAHTQVRQLQLRVHNGGTRARSLRLAAVCEWQLGAQRGDRASVHTGQAPSAVDTSPVLLATQRDASAGFGEGTAFLAWAAAPTRERADAHDWTCSRSECFDRRGRPVLPDRFGRHEGPGLDPCGALGTRFNLAAGESVERTLLLGWAASPSAALALARSSASLAPGQRLQACQAAWDALLGATEVHTPDPLFDAQVNRWLLYQTVGCRLWAKAAFYQAGGATGFRDQLQDTAALAWAAPGMLRAQILLCASRQFAEGDVQHWWHAPGGAGVRTHFSDDLLWLPWALALYLQRSGEHALLDHAVPFIEGQVIAPGAEDAYGTPAVSAQQASLWEHAARAIDRSLPVGVHGLPLMGSGDWNDGMNRVGFEGRGESVWLAWFLCRVVADCLPLAAARGDTARVARWQQALAGWRAALAGPAWGGQWYTRAFFDDGQPLGAAPRTEARIDLIAQAWAVLSGVAPPGRQAQALAAADAQLVDAQAGLIRLLHPPLVASRPSAGYIQAYPPGVRENGGQYSHAGVWALMAQARRAQALAGTQPAEATAAAARAWQYWQHLSPAHRAAQPEQAAVYGAEPYVMAGDVYTAAPWVGRGGWSWYTGAAGWMHRAAVESLFGLQLQASTLCFTPALPPHWPRAAISLRRDGRVLHFLLLRAAPEQALAAAADWSPSPTPGSEKPRALLLPGQSLAWQQQGDGACFVVPLLPAVPGAAEARSGRAAQVPGAD